MDSTGTDTTASSYGYIAQVPHDVEVVRDEDQGEAVLVHEVGEMTKASLFGRPDTDTARSSRLTCMTVERPWYSQLREQWKPAHINLLMIAESAPDDGGIVRSRRFFYAERLAADNLFRGVVAAMYDTTKDDLQRSGKRPWLEKLRQDGFFLIDLAPSPVNALSSRRRRELLLQSVPGCVTRAQQLEPEGVVVVKADLYPILAGPLRAAGLHVPQDGPIAFPLGNTRADFIDGFSRARSKLAQ